MVYYYRVCGVGKVFQYHVIFQSIAFPFEFGCRRRCIVCQLARSRAGYAVERHIVYCYGRVLGRISIILPEKRQIVHSVGWYHEVSRYRIPSCHTRQQVIQRVVLAEVYPPRWQYVLKVCHTVIRAFHQRALIIFGYQTHSAQVVIGLSFALPVVFDFILRYFFECKRSEGIYIRCLVTHIRVGGSFVFRDVHRLAAAVSGSRSECPAILCSVAARSYPFQVVSSVFEARINWHTARNEIRREHMLSPHRPVSNASYHTRRTNVHCISSIRCQSCHIIRQSCLTCRLH